MRFHWGHGIAIFFSCFVAFMVFLAVKSHQQNIDLVTEDYYAQELTYGQRMDEIKNAKALEEPVAIKQEGEALIIHFPELDEKIEGQVQLFRPSDKRFDQEAELALNTANQHSMSLAGLPRGYYRVKVSWQAGEEIYYTEETIFIQ